MIYIYSYDNEIPCTKGNVKNIIKIKKHIILNNLKKN